MTIYIAGLGPGAASLLTREVADLLARGLPILLRTRHHPTVDELDPTGAWDNCDDLYATAGAFEEAYRAVAERVLARAAHGDLIFAVPGNPLFNEAAVPTVLEGAAAAAIRVQILPGLTYADAAAGALRLDLSRVQLCDALDLRGDTWRPALVAQCFNSDAAATLKLKLLETYPADHSVAWLRSVGTAEERVDWRPLSQIDHGAVSHLDTLYVPALAPESDTRRFDGLQHLMDRLHGPDGCPWDLAQTHESLRPHLLEEAYEVLEAIDGQEPARLAEELGDLLLQVLMHSAVAQRRGEFAIADVFEALFLKLLRRHTHVFGEAIAGSPEEVHRNWELQKQAESPGRSALDGVPASLPALAASQALQGRARRLGFDWPDVAGPLDKLHEEMAELTRAQSPAEREDELGDVFFVMTNLADRLGLDAEQALRRANHKFRRLFAGVERLAAERHLDMAALDLAGLDALWDEAKAAEPPLHPPAR